MKYLIITGSTLNMHESDFERWENWGQKELGIRLKGLRLIDYESAKETFGNLLYLWTSDFWHR